MSTVETIRRRLGLTQTQLAVGIQVTQGNVSHYEKGQTMPPAVAGRLIEFARANGLDITFDHVYGDSDLPAEPVPTPTEQTEKASA